jgi:hypothetical protein
MCVLASNLVADSKQPARSKNTDIAGRLIIFYWESVIIELLYCYSVLCVSKSLPREVLATNPKCVVSKHTVQGFHSDVTYYTLFTYMYLTCVSYIFM